ncbi:MAG: DNA-binding response regulator [Edaphobacter sp.]|nr:DNA-binding response regulator [Edaphobacter sp.]
MLTYVVACKLNKQIADTLGTVEQTIKVHRRRMMKKKLGARTIVELMQMMTKMDIRDVDKRRKGARSTGAQMFKLIRRTFKGTLIEADGFQADTAERGFAKAERT